MGKCDSSGWPCSLSRGRGSWNRKLNPSHLRRKTEISWMVFHQSSGHESISIPGVLTKLSYLWHSDHRCLTASSTTSMIRAFFATNWATVDESLLWSEDMINAWNADKEEDSLLPYWCMLMLILSWGFVVIVTLCQPSGGPGKHFAVQIDSHMGGFYYHDIIDIIDDNIVDTDNRVLSYRR